MSYYDNFKKSLTYTQNITEVFSRETNSVAPILTSYLVFARKRQILRYSRFEN